MRVLSVIEFAAGPGYRVLPFPNSLEMWCPFIVFGLIGLVFRPDPLLPGRIAFLLHRHSFEGLACFFHQCYDLFLHLVIVSLTSVLPSHSSSCIDECLSWPVLIAV